MNKSFILVLLIAVAAVSGYLLVQQDQVEPVESQLLFDDLAAYANNINKISLENNNGILFSAEILDGSWTVMHLLQASGYPADQESLSGLITALMQTKRLEAKTKIRENHAKLGLDAITKEDSQATLVTLQTADKTWQLLVGKTASSYVGSYARLPNQNQTWLLDQSIDLPAEDSSWLRQPILDIAEEQVVRVTKAGEQGWSIRKAEQADGFVLEAMPEGRELRYASILDNIAGNIADLRFDDLQAWDSEFWQSLEPEAELMAFLSEDAELKISLATQGDDHYVRFESALLQGHWKNWFYKLSSFSAGQLNKNLEDFLAELPSAQDNNSSSIDEGEAPQE